MLFSYTRNRRFMPGPMPVPVKKIGPKPSSLSENSNGGDFLPQSARRTPRKPL